MPKIIAIEFHDNDFHDIFEAFYALMIHRGGLSSYENLTKEKIVKMFNRSSIGFIKILLIITLMNLRRM